MAFAVMDYQGTARTLGLSRSRPRPYAVRSAACLRFPPGTA